MTVLAGLIGFTTPGLLWALALLPVIWIILRVLPPAPILRRFPGVALLVGLTDRESAAVRTPVWLMLIRMLALAAAILGLAGPVLNPRQDSSRGGPLLILADAGWADAADWSARRDRLVTVAREAARNGRPTAFVNLSAGGKPSVVFAADPGLPAKLAVLDPAAWEPAAGTLSDLAQALPEGAFETYWMADGLDRPGRAALATALAAHGRLDIGTGQPAFGLASPWIDAGKLVARVLRAAPGAPLDVPVDAIGLDPAGSERMLAQAHALFETGATAADATFDLPPEVRNRVTRLMIEGRPSAGAVALSDDALKRRKVALVDGGTAQEGLALLSQIHYLREALRPNADLVEGTITDVLKAAPQVIILADIGHVSGADRDALSDWIDEGGLLVRFAGQRLAAAVPEDGAPDSLLPVPIRPGGRSFGGSMSWDAPRAIAPFAEDSPFAGLAVPPDVKVRTQVLAEPGPDLAAHAIATLADGTPLVTRKAMGDGQVVLFHVTANAEWSDLPLSGLFVQMLDRLAVSSLPGADAATEGAEALKGLIWTPVRVLDGYGAFAPAEGIAGVPGERLAKGPPGPDLPPGLYRSADRQHALNVIAPGRVLMAAEWPEGVRVEGTATRPERPVGGWFISLALLLLIADVIATLALSGRLLSARATATTLALAVALPFFAPVGAHAEERLLSDPAMLAQIAGGLVLGYVQTGDPAVDDVSRAGLTGLSLVLTQRTSVEPGTPVAVDLEHDDLSLLPFLYWPVSTAMRAPSPQAYQRLNRFLHSGGLILFDTRDADFAAGGATTPEGQRLQELAAPLDIPPLEPVPEDHVLTRAFYLLRDFPGRYVGGTVWVEAAPLDAVAADGTPFRNLNDGVTPVVIGANDWAAAWAVDDTGQPLFAVGQGLGGERQREFAYRFGVNLVMHVLTGNYKSDQVHVPALLERLGQ